jgi:hypothetical protein
VRPAVTVRSFELLKIENGAYRFDGARQRGERRELDYRVLIKKRY